MEKSKNETRDINSLFGHEKIAFEQYCAYVFSIIEDAAIVRKLSEKFSLYLVCAILRENVSESNRIYLKIIDIQLFEIPNYYIT